MRAFILLASSLLASGVAIADSTRVWNFDVSLDGKSIGYHRFEVTQDGDLERVASEAKFDVKFLFVNAYRYRHTNREVWSANCLRRFSADTRVNRKKLSVQGSREGGQFVVDDGSGAETLGECVMSFAYWNRDFLDAPRLLNPQSGEYVDVEVTPLERDVIEVRGKPVAARAYRISADKLALTVWYSDDDDWLALESIAKGGRVLRYELS
ncbi:MAG: DUF6134 family protein [Pseudomonadota bacterium]